MIWYYASGINSGRGHRTHSLQLTFVLEPQSVHTYIDRVHSVPDNDPVDLQVPNWYRKYSIYYIYIYSIIHAKPQSINSNKDAFWIVFNYNSQLAQISKWYMHMVYLRIIWWVVSDLECRATDSLHTAIVEGQTWYRRRSVCTHARLVWQIELEVQISE